MKNFKEIKSYGWIWPKGHAEKKKKIPVTIAIFDDGGYEIRCSPTPRSHYFGIDSKVLRKILDGIMTPVVHLPE